MVEVAAPGAVHVAIVALMDGLPGIARKAMSSSRASISTRIWPVVAH